MSITLLINYKNANDTIVVQPDITIGALLDRLYSHYALNPQTTSITLNGSSLSPSKRSFPLTGEELKTNNGICFLFFHFYISILINSYLYFTHE